MTGLLLAGGPAEPQAHAAAAAARSRATASSTHGPACQHSWSAQHHTSSRISCSLRQSMIVSNIRYEQDLLILQRDTPVVCDGQRHFSGDSREQAVA